MPPHHLYSPLLYFSSVWDYVPVRFYFAGDVVVPWMSDAIAINKGDVDRVDPIPRDHHQNMCAKGVLSDAIDISPCDTWLREEPSIFIGRAKSIETWACVMGQDSTNFGKSIAQISSCWWTVRVSRRNFSLKTDVFPLCILTFDRIVKLLRNF